MTQQNMVEILQKDFPDYGETLLVLELKKGERDFVSKTLILDKAFTTWTSATDLLAITPAFHSIKKIAFVDANDNVLGVDYAVEDGYLVYDDDRVDHAEGMYYYYPPSTWTSDIPTIPEQFHEALTYYVLKKIAVSKGLPQASIYNAEYEKALKEGKKYRNTKNQSSEIRILRPIL